MSLVNEKIQSPPAYDVYVYRLRSFEIKNNCNVWVIVLINIGILSSCHIRVPKALTGPDAYYQLQCPIRTPNIQYLAVSV